MAQQDWKLFRLALEWGALLTTAIAMIQGSGSLQPWSIVTLGFIGAASGTIAIYEHGWYRSNCPAKMLIKSFAFLTFLWGVMAFLSYLVWPTVAVKEIAVKEIAPLPQPERIQEPHLDVQLHVDSSRKNRTLIRLLLENNGDVAMRNVSSFLASDNFSFSLPLGPNLAPKDKAEIGSGLFVGKRPKSIDVYLTYDCDVGPQFALFKFFIPSFEAGNTPILPLSTSQGSGGISVESGGEALAQQQFSRNEGSIMPVFPEKTPEGKYNLVFWRTPTRVFILDSARKKIAFHAAYKQGSKSIEGAITPSPSGIYIVYMFWNDTERKLILYVNGKRVLDSVRRP